jgi:hypothetical protein
MSSPSQVMITTLFRSLMPLKRTLRMSNPEYIEFVRNTWRLLWETVIFDQVEDMAVEKHINDRPSLRIINNLEREGNA